MNVVRDIGHSMFVLYITEEVGYLLLPQKSKSKIPWRHHNRSHEFCITYIVSILDKISIR